MTAKKNKFKKLDKKWMAYMVDFIAGPTLMLLGMKEPLGAQKLQNIMTNELQKLWKLPKYRDVDTNVFVVDASEMLVRMINLYMTAKLIKYLEDGVPEPPKILTNVQQMHTPKRFN